MLVVRVGSLTDNEVTLLDKVPRELADTANDKCNIPPPCDIRLYYSVHHAAGVPGAQGPWRSVHDPAGFALPARSSTEMSRCDSAFSSPRCR